MPFTFPTGWIFAWSSTRSWTPYRIYNVAPWVSPKMQGVIGTNPIRYEIAGVESADGDAEMFRSLLTVRGGGRMEFRW